LKQWKRHLLEYQSFLKELAREGEAQLRFGRKTVVASDVAEQFYCEKKVEMQYLHGEIETEAKNIGTEAHNKLLEDTIAVKQEQLWKKIYGAKTVLARECIFFAKVGKVVLAGKPDLILFRNGLPLVVIEHKFSKKLIGYETYHVQARMYGLLLSSIGFDTKSLLYAIVVADPDARFDNNLKKNVLQAIDKNGLKEGTLKLDNARVFLCKYNGNEAQSNLDWAVKFWKLEREALATRNLNKCKTCEYFEKC
jgi:hypothetical protein